MPITNVPSVAAKIAAVRTRYESAHAVLRKSESEEISALRLECSKIGHRWRLQQVAGDGRVCDVCGEHDSTDD